MGINVIRIPQSSGGITAPFSCPDTAGLLPQIGSTTASARSASCAVVGDPITAPTSYPVLDDARGMRPEQAAAELRVSASVGV